MIVNEDGYQILLDMIRNGLQCNCDTTEYAEIVTPEKDSGKAITKCELCKRPRSTPYDVDLD